MDRAQLFFAAIGVCVVAGALSASAAATSDAGLGVLLGVAMLVTAGLLRWRRRD